MKTLLLAMLIATPVLAQVDIQVDLGPPPSEYIATTDPVYYEGHPAYFYNGYWHYRDERGRWLYYRNEPVFLREHHYRAQPVRHYYERPMMRREERHEERHEEYRRH